MEHFEIKLHLFYYILYRLVNSYRRKIDLFFHQRYMDIG